MYIVNPGISWLKSPLLYMQEGFVFSHADIHAIMRQGYTEVYHDPSRFRQASSTQSAPAPVGDVWPDHTAPKVALGEEMPRARTTYAETFEHVKDLMQDARGGAVDLAASQPYIEAIIKSLGRNGDALLSLTKLRRCDKYAYTHSVNVAIFSVAYAHYLGLPENKLHLVGLAGLFHDFGKIFIPQAILDAPRKLTRAEREIMQAHVLLGYNHLVKEKDIHSEVLQGVMQHHEKYNGSGYPNRLRGSKISIYGLILSLSDHYDALSSKRVYKEPMPANVALAVMYKMREEAWAPGYVERFIKMMGVYPVGTPVLLSNGERGAVCHSNPEYPTLPKVMIAFNPVGVPVPPRLRDLREHPGLDIERSLTGNDAEMLDVGMLLSHA